MTTETTNPREQRGLVIAATSKIRKKGNVWIVPSQKGGRASYTVSPDKEQPHCSCPDHMDAGHKCKHIFAVEFVIQRELFDDGTVTETRTVTVTETKKRSYPQQWRAYNAAQVNEKDSFLALLRDLCSRIEEKERKATGRKPFPIRDAIFAACYKVYSTLSGRRFMSDLRAAKEKGYIGRVPSYNMIFKVFEQPETFEILRSLVVLAASPLRSLETNFAIDSSGFSGCRFDKWFDHKFGDRRILRAWVKCHVMTGVRTNCITAVEIHGQSAGDCVQLPALLATTKQTFKIEEVSADLAYSTEDNLYAVDAIGAAPMIPFKSNASTAKGGLWEKMLLYFKLHREEFDARYHLRSNVETTFSMCKAKFGDSLRSKTDVAMKNETLAKLVCHNVCCVIQAMHELGISPDFAQAS
jgi:transposase